MTICLLLVRNLHASSSPYPTASRRGVVLALLDIHFAQLSAQSASALHNIRSGGTQWLSGEHW